MTPETEVVMPGPEAIALAPMVGVWQGLLREHVRDRNGRCAKCRWQTRSADWWPCNVYLLAAAAGRAAKGLRL